MSHNKFVFKVSTFVLLLLWILSGGSVISVFQRNILLALILAYTVCLIIFNGRKIKKSLISAFIFAFLGVSACIFLDYIFSIKPQDFTKYLFLCLEFFVSGVLCIYLFSVFTFREFESNLFRVLKFIRWHALISAVLYIGAPFLFNLHIYNEYNQYDAYSFMWMFFKLSNQYSFNIFGFSLVRNQGLFWEPGVLQFYLNLLLFLQLYVFKTKNIGIALTVCAIISTYSTSAYIIMVIISALAIFNGIKRQPGIYFPLTILIMLLFIPFMLGNLQNKFDGEKTNSSYARLVDVVQQAFVIEDNFWTGVGIDDQQYAKIRSTYLIQGVTGDNTQSVSIDRGSTNSILFIWATMGFPVGCLWLIAYLQQPFIRARRWIISVLLLLSIFVEPLLLKQFFITFVISGFMVMYYKIRYKKSKSIWLKEKVLIPQIENEQEQKTLNPVTADE